MPHSPNTLFDPSVLAQAFPDAASSGHLDGLDPHRTPYEALARQFREHQTALGIAAQAAVSVDTATVVAELMHTPARYSLDSLLGTSPEAKRFAESVKGVHRTVDDMLHKTNDVFTLPGLDSSEFKNTNWQRLYEATSVYEQLGIASAVVFAPINRPLEGSHGWKTFFSQLRAWQDTNHPDATNKLQHQTDGDGLWINDEIPSQWNDVIDTTPNAPQWQVSVLPVTDKAPVLGAAYDGTNKQGALPQELQNILAKLPPHTPQQSLQQPLQHGTPTPNATVPNTGVPTQRHELLHPTAETLLTTHAIRHFEGKDPIDGKIGSTYYWSWANGIINNGAYGLAVRWSPDFGQVSVSRDGVGNRDGRLGVRPEVRG